MSSNETLIIIGKGFLAGAVGVVGLILSQEIEKHLFQQEPSRAPAEVADELLDLQQKSKASRAEFNTVIESVYGSGWGIFRSFLGSQGLRGPSASALHLAAIGANVSLLMPAIGLVQPVRKWDKQKLAFELVHHSVYVVCTGIACDFLVKKGQSSF